MLTIGLTGPTGAGKGAVAAILQKYGFPHIDTDAVYRELLIPPSPLLDELALTFGEEVIAEDGGLNRVALAAKVFAPGQEAELERLNAITHPHILGEVRRRLDAFAKQSEIRDGPHAVVVDAPQLFESGFDRECDLILSVLAPVALRLERVMARDGLNEQEALARLNASHADEFFRERSHFVLVNDGHIQAMEAEVDRLLTEWGVRP